MSETPANPMIPALDLHDVTVASLKNPTVIVAEGVFDNTAANQNNPNRPPKDVG